MPISTALRSGATSNGRPAAAIASPAQSVAPTLAIFQATRQFEHLWLSRIEEISCGQVGQYIEGNPPCPKPASGWWMKGFGYWGNQDTRDGFAGYSLRLLGGMVAYDAPLGPETRIGAGFGYAAVGAIKRQA